tara:strand:+ start:791 stop:979 length:189 start_codon:yes stop_codon:yes gene_type:complete
MTVWRRDFFMVKLSKSGLKTPGFMKRSILGVQSKIELSIPHNVPQTLLFSVFSENLTLVKMA